MPDSDLTTKLNALMADCLVLTVKLHNYHWHIRGREFYALHAATEDYYNHFFGQYDDLAERILQLGGTPSVTLEQILGVTTLKEESATSFSAVDVLKALMDDFTALKDAALALTGGPSDSITESLLLDFAGYLEKAIWMGRTALSAM